MPTRTSQTGSELFIVDNSSADWKVLRYLNDWCQISKAIDIATGYFDISSLLALKDEWKKVGKIRILMGDEVSKQTRHVLVQGLTERLDDSIEEEKTKNDFLAGVPDIADAIRDGKIECRVYRKEKFHAKAYITHALLEVVGSSALVGSSNFTHPGITENIELNVQITGSPVRVLQEWYEEHWKAAEPISPEILRTIERHIREYSPFDAYTKALYEFFRGHEMTAGEWELADEKDGGSRIYKVLDQYQKEGYHALMNISSRFGGALLCDGVGLGKTYVGMMLIERLVNKDGKRVALFVPKAAREDVWEREIRRYLPDISGLYRGFHIFNHTDLLREGNIEKDLNAVAKHADVIIIDEAHHFRNPGRRPIDGEMTTRYWRLFDLAKDKTIYMLTATPINNRITDLQHMIELFTRRKSDHFKAAPLGIASLPNHFRRLEKSLEKAICKKGERPEHIMMTDLAEAEQVLWNDDLFRAIVVQRSRAYVKMSQEQHLGNKAVFPKRESPRVAVYDLKKTYGKLLVSIRDAFAKEKPLFSLAVYNPRAYLKLNTDGEKKEDFADISQKEVVSLIRTQFLKRFESSAMSYKISCGMLLKKLMAWIVKHNSTLEHYDRYKRWCKSNEQILGNIMNDQRELFGDNDEDDADEDIISAEMLEKIEVLSPDEYSIDDIMKETYKDLDQIIEFLSNLERIKPGNDDKLKALIRLLKTDKDLKGQKVLIFTEYMATARYLARELNDAGFDGVDQLDSASGRDRSEVIRAFAPYYNSTDPQLFETARETQILVSTDVLSEGLNLQDCTRLINYDLHWNPVRLMQRIGRIDRRLNPEIEARIRAERPEIAATRGTVMFWNFLPPDELDNLLMLYARVSKKTLRISKVFGIEGKKLLKPDDDYEALKEFHHSYEGRATETETMLLEYQKLLNEHPELEQRLSSLPNRIFSGKKHPSVGCKAVFFCYALPAQRYLPSELADKNAPWSTEFGFSRWYLYDLQTEKILDDSDEIVKYIRCTPDTPRICSAERKTLMEIRQLLDNHVRNGYLRQVQAPQGVKAILKVWMELC